VTTPSKKQLRRAARAGRLAAELSATMTAARRAEEQAAESLRADDAPTGARRRALLIINTKSGSNDDSILRVREIVAELARHGVDAEVRVKLRKKQARRLARRAAKEGYTLVVAAGGDGTVAAVARGLIGRPVALGIVPLGTYNNLAVCLGVPLEVPAACALIGTGATRAIDVGMVRPHERKKPRPFFEMVSIGLSAALMPAGQEAKDGNWATAAAGVGEAAAAEPARVTLRLDGGEPARELEALLLQVCCAPRSGPALVVAPDARMDDGLLDVVLFRDTSLAGLAALFAAMQLGAPVSGSSETLRAARVEVAAEPALPVAADARVIGTTPVEVGLLPGALLAIVGDGFGLERPAAPALVEAARAVAATRTAEPPPAARAAAASARADAVERAVPPVARPAVRRLVRWLGR
jgi:diacylglycerol kinase (ATP)